MADVDSRKLKPCPFCGGKAVEDWCGVSEFYGHDHQTGSIECEGCFATISITSCCNKDGSVTPGFEFACSCHNDLGAVIRSRWNTRQPEAALLARIAELELLADDARGKRCPECSAPMVSLSTIDGGQRVCSGCDKVWSWHLKEGQPPLIGNNRMVKKV